MGDIDTFFEGSKNKRLSHPDTGLEVFGVIPEISHRGEHFEKGNIILKVGKHIGPHKGFGANHILAEHHKDLLHKGYEGKEGLLRFISEIIAIGSHIYCEFSDIRGNHRPTVLKSNKGIVVLERKPNGDQIEYSVITAFPHKRVHGTRIGTIEIAPK